MPHPGPDAGRRTKSGKRANAPGRGPARASPPRGGSTRAISERRASAVLASCQKARSARAATARRDLEVERIDEPAQLGARAFDDGRVGRGLALAPQRAPALHQELERRRHVRGGSRSPTALEVAAHESALVVRGGGVRIEEERALGGDAARCPRKSDSAVPRLSR
jgi:hypothetical protein